jgi:hypothetical protein
VETQVPEPIIDKIRNLKPPQNKTQMQHLMCLFGYWRLHIPYLQLILQPLYKVTRKASDFEWGIEQQNTFKTMIQYISDFKQLHTIQPNNTITIDIHLRDTYSNWSVFAKPMIEPTKPVAFYCKCFPYSENRYSL